MHWGIEGGVIIIKTMIRIIEIILMRILYKNQSIRLQIHRTLLCMVLALFIYLIMKRDNIKFSIMLYLNLLLMNKLYQLIFIYRFNINYLFHSNQAIFLLRLLLFFSRIKYFFSQPMTKNNRNFIFHTIKYHF